MRAIRALRWAVRGVIGGVLAGVLSGVLLMLLGRVVEREYVAMVAVAALFGSFLPAGAALLWPWPQLSRARYFDRRLRLRERLSAAIEISQGVLQPPAGLAARQREDAQRACSQVDARRQLPLRIPGRELALAFSVILLSALPYLFGDRFFTFARRQQEIRRAIEEEAARVASVQEAVANTGRLEPESVETLLSPLDGAEEGLQEATTLEQAIATLDRAEGELRELSDAQAEDWSRRLQAAGRELLDGRESPMGAFAEHASQGEFPEAAASLKDLDLGDLDEEEMGQLGQELTDLAESIGETDSALADRLARAGQALERGDRAAAERELTEAARALEAGAQRSARAELAGDVAGELDRSRAHLLDRAQQLGSGEAIAGLPGEAEAEEGGGRDQVGETDSAGGSSVGSESSDHQGATGEEASDQPIGTGNGSEPAGETSYVPLDVPRRLRGGTGPTVLLPAGEGEGFALPGAGASTRSADGDGLIPYEEVFVHYESYASHAIDDLQPPAHLEAIVWQYFTSLAP